MVRKDVSSHERTTFEKKYFGKLSGVRGSALLAKREGGNKKETEKNKYRVRSAAFVFIYLKVQNSKHQQYI